MYWNPRGGAASSVAQLGNDGIAGAGFGFSGATCLGARGAGAAAHAGYRSRRASGPAAGLLVCRARAWPARHLEGILVSSWSWVTRPRVAGRRDNEAALGKSVPSIEGHRARESASTVARFADMRRTGRGRGRKGSGALGALELSIAAFSAGISYALGYFWVVRIRNSTGFGQGSRAQPVLYVVATLICPSRCLLVRSTILPDENKAV